MTVQEMVEAQRVKYRNDSRRPTLICYCPDAVPNPRIGLMYSVEVGLSSPIPEHLVDAECKRCRREGNCLFLIYQMTDEIQKTVEGGKAYVVPAGQD